MLKSVLLLIFFLLKLMHKNSLTNNTTNVLIVNLMHLCKIKKNSINFFIIFFFKSY